jgi:hypothetical protein
MALFYETMRRLDVRGPASRGIVVDAKGAMLGPSCTLVQRTAAGYRCVRPAAAAAIQKAVFGAEDEDPDRLFILSRGIAKALNDGELALAQIYGLRIPIAGLDSGQLRKLSAAATWVKANFNPDEPRIPAGEPGAGEWTYGGDDEGSEAADSSEPGTPPSGGAPAAIPVGTTATFDATDETAASIFEPGTPPGDGVPAAVAVGRTTTAAATAETAASIFGPLGRTALATLDALAADMAGPVAFLGVLFLPTNSSLISEGRFPAAPISPTATIRIPGFSASIARMAPTGSWWRRAASALTDCSITPPAASLGAVSAAPSWSIRLHCRLPSEERTPRLKVQTIGRSFAPTQPPRASKADQTEQSPISPRSPACRPVWK